MFDDPLDHGGEQKDAKSAKKWYSIEGVERSITRAKGPGCRKERLESNFPDKETVIIRE